MNNAFENVNLDGKKFNTLEVSADASQGEELKKCAKDELGSDYTAVKKFFAEKFGDSEKYEYIIVKVRRAYMLARIFCVILLSEAKDQENEELYKKYKRAAKILRSDIFLSSPDFLNRSDCAENADDISDDAADETGRVIVKNKTNRILLLDDIIIHGRALSELLEYLVEKQFYEVDHIDVDSIVIFKDAECLSECLQNKIRNQQKTDNRINATEKEWKILSNKFVALIQHSAQSYAAFTDSYTLPQDYKFEEHFNYHVKEISSAAQKNADIIMQVFYDDSRFISNSLRKCLRCYKDNSVKCQKRNVVIPFVSLPFMQLENWQKIYKKLDLFKNVKTFNVNKETLGSVDVFSYKLVSNVLSDVYASELHFENATTNNLLYSFDFDVSEHTDDITQIINVINEECSSVSDSAFDDENKGDIDYDTELTALESIYAVNMWREIVSSHTEVPSQELLCDMVRQFLDTLHAENEKRAKDNKPRLPGIPLYALFVVLRYYHNLYNWNLRDISYWTFYAYVMSLWDVGIASYNVDLFTCKKKKYIGGCMTDGEQAYHALMEESSAAEIFAVHLLGNYTRNSYEFSLKLGDLIRNADETRGMLNSKRLMVVGDYYSKHHSVKELFNIYPATDEQQKELRQRIRALCGID